MKAKRSTRRAGQTGRFDFQADVYGGQYRLVKCIGPGKWLCEHLPPDEQTKAAICADDYLSAEEAAALLARREEQAGSTFPMQFVSAQEYARYF